MFVRLLPALALLVLPSIAHAITLEQAQRTPTLSVDITDARGYEAVQITIENHGSVPVVVRDMPGVVLENDVATEQDLTLTQPLAIAVDPGKHVTVTVATYCIRPHDDVPHAGGSFHAHGADGAIGEYLRAHYTRAARNDVQHQVWRMTDDVPPGAPTTPAHAAE
jgi:hypothetical protein